MLYFLYKTIGQSINKSTDKKWNTVIISVGKNLGVCFACMFRFSLIEFQLSVLSLRSAVKACDVDLSLFSSSFFGKSHIH